MDGKWRARSRNLTVAEYMRRAECRELARVEPVLPTTYRRRVEIYNTQLRSGCYEYRSDPDDSAPVSQPGPMPPEIVLDPGCAPGIACSRELKRKLVLCARTGGRSESLSFMIVKKTDNGYEFLAYTSEGAFLVTLTLSDTGAESLRTVPVGVPVSFTPLKLRRGTIKKAIGDQRWQNFIRMRKLAISTMLT